MKRRFIAATVCIALVATICACAFSLTGCGSSKSKIKTTKSTEFSEPVGEESATTSQQQDTSSDTNKTADVKNDSSNTKTAALSAAMKKAKKATKGLVSSYGTEVAVAVTPLDGSKGFAINGDEKFTSASMIKLLILAEFANEVDAGTLSLSDTWNRDSSKVVGGTGQIQYESNASYTYDELARYMIMYSDNTATNVLIERMGMDAINARATTLGLSNTDLQRKMMDLNSGVENHMSVNDATTLLKGFYNGTIASAKMCKKALGYLKQQTDKNGIAQGLPSGVTYGHKSGDLDPIRHDGGIVFADSPYVIVVFTKIGASSANSLMSQVSSAVYEQIK